MNKKQEKKNDKAPKVSASHPTTSTALAKPDKRPSAAKNIASTQISTSRNRNLKCSSKSVAQNFSDFTKEKNIAGAKPVKRSNTVKTVESLLQILLYTINFFWSGEGLDFQVATSRTLICWFAPLPLKNLLSRKRKRNKKNYNDL